MDKLNVAQSGLSLLSLQVLLLPCGTENKQNKEKVMQAMLKHYQINNKKFINISIKPFWIPSSIKLNAFHYFVLMNSTCSISKLKTAFCKYRTPPWINLVLLLLVPEEKSNFSTKPVFNPTKQFFKCPKKAYPKNSTTNIIQILTQIRDQNSDILNPAGMISIYHLICITGNNIMDGIFFRQTLTSAYCIQSDPTTSGASPNH